MRDEQHDACTCAACSAPMQCIRVTPDMLRVRMRMTYDIRDDAMPKMQSMIDRIDNTMRNRNASERQA
jgi:hypothetical protein